MRTSDIKLLVLTFIIISVSFLEAASVVASDKQVDRLSKRIIVINDGYYRVIAINTGEGIVVIDAHVSVKDMQECMKIITDEFNTNDFRYVVYSHGDLEHVLGHQALENSVHVSHIGLRLRSEKNARFIAYIDSILPAKEAEFAFLDSTDENYTNILDEINKLKWHRQANYIAIQLKPDIEFSDRMVLAFDSMNVEIIYYGMGHGYSLFVSVPEEQFLFCSTASSTILIPFWFLEHNTDYVDVERSIGILSEFVNQQDSLKHIVPCHGPYLTNRQLEETYDYHRVMYESIEAAIKQEKSLNEVLQELALNKTFADYSFAREANEETIDKHTRNIELMWDYLKNQ